MKIYVASSWRNESQPTIVERLKIRGHEVYDFRNPPPPGLKNGFRWSSIDPKWQSWSAKDYRDALATDIAQDGFQSDKRGMDWADVCLLLLPAGRSAHLEAGYMAGAGKKVIVLTRDGEEPELMALLLDYVAIDFDDVLNRLSKKAKVC